MTSGVPPDWKNWALPVMFRVWPASARFELPNSTKLPVRVRLPPSVAVALL